MADQQLFPDGFTEPHILSGLSADASILVGFSGGADSSALLHLLSRYGKLHGTRICAAHVNHGIRGDEADRDEAFCRSVCSSMGIEFFSIRADVPKIAKESGKSVETAARDLRYSFFEEIMERENIPILATAHNADDNLETMIFNLVRGSSLGGICGIPEARLCQGGCVIRPILCMPKADILRYCRDNSLEYVTDSTNTDTDYTRNKIRSEVIPRLCEINSGAVKNASRLSRALRADAICLDGMRDAFMDELCEGFSVSTEKLNGSPEAVASRALVALYKDISCGGSLEYTHISALRRLSAKGVPHSSVTLPDGIEAVIENGRLVFRKAEKKKDIPSYKAELNEGSNLISQTNCEIIMVYSQNTKNIYKNSILMSIDFDKISGKLFVRNRMAGDKIFTCGMHKSVKKLMCDKKIPVHLRDRLPVICDGEGIVAIPLVALRDGVSAKGDDSVRLYFYAY